ncbi:MAG TPA: hypothetical protein VHV55_13250 [Pirellulales bacterium]|jgi:hypothetical protein|nr:hypothetical protein [Pirellulales bacterium]
MSDNEERRTLTTDFTDNTDQAKKSFSSVPSVKSVVNFSFFLFLLAFPAVVFCATPDTLTAYAAIASRGGSKFEEIAR